MEPRTVPGGMEMVKVQKKTRSGNVNSMSVGPSRSRPFNVPAFSKSKKMKKKGLGLGSGSGSGSGSCWDEPEMKRRRRVAKYKLYSAEGRLKSSFKLGIRWIKRKCSVIARRA